MKLISLIADYWKMDGGVAFGVVPKSMWSRFCTADENNMVPIVTRCLLVVDGKRKLLIDTGLGKKRMEKYYAVRYRQPGTDIISSLAAHNISPDDITDILFTHLHDDHVGAATRYDENGEILHVFLNADYYVSQAQWDWALKPNKREAAAFFADNLIPLQRSGRLKLLQQGEQPFANIQLRIFDGHTRGQLIPIINAGSGTIVYMGDFIPTTTNLPLPYIPSVDIEPLKSLSEKELFLQEAWEKNYKLFFEHDALAECCTLKKTEKGIACDKIFRLQPIDL